MMTGRFLPELTNDNDNNDKNTFIERTRQRDTVCFEYKNVSKICVN